ncbi:MAG: hypothetical protein K2J30_06035, partial [Clostridia bacterium]|nr:hypothetical protein [Clostridia bacterium]
MIKKSEKLILKAYLDLPVRKLLKHQFELEEDYLAGYVSRFLHGERFHETFIPFSDNELEVIDPLIEANSENKDGKDLLTAKLLTQLVC